MSYRNCMRAFAASRSKSQRTMGTTSRWRFLIQTEKAGCLKWVRWWSPKNLSCLQAFRDHKSVFFLPSKFLFSLLKVVELKPGRGGGSFWQTAACTTFNTPQWVSLHQHDMSLNIINIPLVVESLNLSLRSDSSSRIKTQSGLFLWRTCVSGSYKT